MRNIGLSTLEQIETQLIHVDSWCPCKAVLLYSQRQDTHQPPTGSQDASDTKWRRQAICHQPLGVGHVANQGPSQVDALLGLFFLMIPSSLLNLIYYWFIESRYNQEQWHDIMMSDSCSRVWIFMWFEYVIPRSSIGIHTYITNNNII